MVWESESSTGNFEDLQKYITIVNDRLAFGADQEEVVQQIVKMGLTESVARGLVKKSASRLTSAPSQNLTAAERARATQRKPRAAVAPDQMASIPVIFVVALFAAIVGAFIWNVIVDVTGYEIGYVAWFLGGLVGAVVMGFAKGDDRMIIPLIAAVMSLFGIFLGKYLQFLGAFNEFIDELANMNASELSEVMEPEYFLEIGHLSVTNGMTAFMDFGFEFSAHDALWIFLAVSTAWGIASYNMDES